MNYQEYRTKLFKELRDSSPVAPFPKELHTEYEKLHPKAVKEFIDSINFKPLKAFVENYAGVKLRIKVTPATVKMSSESLLDKVGLLNKTFQEVTLQSNASVDATQAELFYRGSLDFSYEYLSGGTNTSRLLYMSYQNGVWAVRTALKDDVLYTLDAKGNPQEPFNDL